MQQCRWAGVWNTKNAAVGFEKKGSLASRIKLVPKGSKNLMEAPTFAFHWDVSCSTRRVGGRS